MSELTSARATEQAIAQHAEDPFIVLLTISHPSLAAPYRFARNREKIISNGETFGAAYFEIELPGDGDAAPQATITVANIDRRIGQALERLPADDNTICTIDIVLASTPDIIERRWEQFTLQEASWDSMALQGKVGRAMLYDEPWPNLRVTTRLFRSISADA
ncbi:MAG TPA: DUF1833 family protein [Xanthobacteraceae bacterium]|nr:DUF1833 family protein [Xanthobacteraceae bacterium]